MCRADKLPYMSRERRSEGVLRSVAFSVLLVSVVSIAMDELEKKGEAHKFGHKMKEEFLLAPGYRNFNHGSFGAMPKAVWDAQKRYQEQAESRPDKWFREDYQILIESSRATIAAYVNAPSTADIVMIENASGGCNAVMRSLDWGSGGVIMYLSSAYAMVKNTAQYLAQTVPGLRAVEVELGSDFPMGGDDSVLKPLEKALRKHAGEVKLFIISHIASVPGVIMPVEAAIKMTRDPAIVGKQPIPVLVDGAHALGQIHVDIQALGDPDYYLSNGHKWFYTPKSAAFLYVRQDRQLPLSPEPTVISSSGKQDFVGRFDYTGTRDYTAFVAFVDAFKFREKLGDELIYNYNTQLAAWAAAHLSQRWGTKVLSPPHMQAYMFNVELPTKSAAVGAALHDRLEQDYDAYMLSLQLGDIVYTRLSAQVYLDKASL
mmetsp:Transcript_26259/g.62173  ORF Transcript_26259/g.62173 Transcript_26259/m.62173 type:complete len:430 (-) Transcript_26259:233-1522(-)